MGRLLPSFATTATGIRPLLGGLLCVGFGPPQQQLLSVVGLTAGGLHFVGGSPLWQYP